MTAQQTTVAVATNTAAKLPEPDITSDLKGGALQMLLKHLPDSDIFNPALSIQALCERFEWSGKAIGETCIVTGCGVLNSTGPSQGVPTETLFMFDMIREAQWALGYRAPAIVVIGLGIARHGQIAGPLDPRCLWNAAWLTCVCEKYNQIITQAGYPPVEILIDSDYRFYQGLSKYSKSLPPFGTVLHPYCEAQNRLFAYLAHYARKFKLGRQILKVGWSCEDSLCQSLRVRNRLQLDGSQSGTADELGFDLETFAFMDGSRQLCHRTALGSQPMASLYCRAPASATGDPSVGPYTSKGNGRIHLLRERSDALPITTCDGLIQALACTGSAKSPSARSKAARFLAGNLRTIYRLRRDCPGVLDGCDREAQIYREIDPRGDLARGSFTGSITPEIVHELREATSSAVPQLQALLGVTADEILTKAAQIQETAHEEIRAVIA